MALKSSVLACLILALCMGCNNVMAQNTDLKETEKSDCQIVGETEDRYKFQCRNHSMLICDRASPLWRHIDEAKLSANLSCFSVPVCLKGTNKSGFIIPRSENLGKETEKSGFIIPRSENLGKENVKSGDIICWIAGQTDVGGNWTVACGPSMSMSFICPHELTLSCEIDEGKLYPVRICTARLKCTKGTNKNGFIIPRSENLGKKTEKSGNIIP